MAGKDVNPFLSLSLVISYPLHPSQGSCRDMAGEVNPRPAKQARTEAEILPANIIIQFQNDSGETTGKTLPSDFYSPPPSLPCMDRTNISKWPAKKDIKPSYFLVNAFRPQQHQRGQSFICYLSMPLVWSQRLRTHPGPAKVQHRLLNNNSVKMLGTSFRSVKCIAPRLFNQKDVILESVLSSSGFLCSKFYQESSRCWTSKAVYLWLLEGKSDLDVHSAGPQLDLPHNVTPANLETLLNGLLQKSETQPYSFFIDEQQLTDDLGSFLQSNKVCYCHSNSVYYVLAGMEKSQNADDTLDYDRRAVLDPSVSPSPHSAGLLRFIPYSCHWLICQAKRCVKDEMDVCLWQKLSKSNEKFFSQSLKPLILCNSMWGSS